MIKHVLSPDFSGVSDYIISALGGAGRYLREYW